MIVWYFKLGIHAAQSGFELERNAGEEGWLGPLGWETNFQHTAARFEIKGLGLHRQVVAKGSTGLILAEIAGRL